MRHSLFIALALAAAAACNGPHEQAMASLDAEMRRLRTDHERMATQIDQINNRLVLTEDTARAARTAAESADRRRVISLGADAPPAEPIRVDSTVRGVTGDDDNDTNNRPTIRAARGDRPADPSGFNVISAGGERLQVAPAPPLPAPGTAPRPNGAPPVTPAPTGARGPGASNEMIPINEGSGSLDPAAVTAYDEALRQARGGRCHDAIDGFTRFLTRWPDHPHADNAMYWRAECVLQGGDRHRAVQEFEALVTRFPAGNKVPDALYKLAVTYRRLGDRAAADRATQRLTADFPDSEAARRIQAERE